MTWRSIFELGEVDLYWLDRYFNRRPLSELPYGSISVIDGVIVIDGVPSVWDPSIPFGEDVAGVIAVPRYSTAGLRARVTLSEAHIPTWNMYGPRAVIFNRDDPDDYVEVWTDPVIEGDDPRVVVDFDPSQFEIGDMPSNAELAFYYEELVG